jgi:hypothetical protein
MRALFAAEGDGHRAYGVIALMEAVCHVQPACARARLEAGADVARADDFWLVRAADLREPAPGRARVRGRAARGRRRRCTGGRRRRDGADGCE